MNTEIRVDDIREYLRLSDLDEDEINRRAPIITQDLIDIRFDHFRLSSEIYPYPDLATGSFIPKPLAEYHFGDTGFSIHKAVNPFGDSATWFGGTGLDRGHLQFLSKVSLIGHHVIPQYWLTAKKLRQRLRNPSQHLDTLEEVWWLARWRRLRRSGVRMDQRLAPHLQGDVDWQVELPDSGLTLNLEVKRLKFDVVRVGNRRAFSARRFEEFCDREVIPKFRPSLDREVNVLALTIFGDVTAEVNHVLNEWLVEKQDLIDAILVTAHHPFSGGLFYLHFANQKAKDIQSELRPPDKEDNAMWFPIEMTIQIPGVPFTP